MDVRRTLKGASSARSQEITKPGGGTSHTHKKPVGSSVKPQRPQNSASPNTAKPHQPQISTPPTSTKPQPPQYPTPPGIEMSETFPGVVKPIAEETVMEWKAPSRPFKKRRRQYYTTLGTIVLLLSLILFFAGQFLPVAVVLAVAFLAYVLSSIPPHEVNYKITTYGIRLENQLYYWQELGRYWFESKYDQDMVIVEVVRFPNRLTMMLGKQITRRQIADVLSEVLLKQKPEPGIYEKASKWLQEKVPLDIEGTSSH